MSGARQMSDEELFDAAPDGLIVVDGAGRVVRANRAAEGLLGRSRAELLGQPFAGSLLGVADLVGREPAQPGELVIRLPDGSERTVEATASRADPDGWLIIALRDVAWRKQVANRQGDEEQIRNQQMLRAEQMAAIGQVAAGVAHELRNPLTSVKGLVQVNLREAVSRGLPTEDLRVIEHEVRRMERTLQTFLDFARPPRLYRQKLDLNGIVDRVSSLVGGRARKQSVELNFARPADPVAIDGDEDQLQQLILNLVLNALDALPSGGAIDIEVRPPRDGLAELLVRDSGPGIAPNILPKVFETFVSNKETGIGLGLPVSRRIAEEHGGTLAAFNLPAGGACFVLRLPAPSGRGTGVASGGGDDQASGS